MDAIITQVQNLASTANEAGRKEVIDALRNLQYSIETPHDTLNRFAGLVNYFFFISYTQANLIEPPNCRRAHWY